MAELFGGANGGGRGAFPNANAWCPPPSLTSPFGEFDMSVDLTSFVTVFKTGQLVHLDWASNALEEAGIPYQRREETSGGIRLAMPVAPATGPGTWWSIIVPESSVEQARELLAELPFDQTTTPDVWSFQPKRGVKLGWQIYAGIVVGGMVIALIMQILRHWR
jgi:hypothetical protein